MSETRKICNMRIASKERIANMSLANLKAYRKKAMGIRKRYQYMNKHVCCESCHEIIYEIRPYTEQEVKDIKTLDWLKNYLKKEIKRRTDGTN